MKQYYRIGNITIEYDGLPFKETDEISSFQSGPVTDPEICCTLNALSEIVNAPSETDSSLIRLKSDWECILSTPEGRELLLTDRQKRTELLIKEKAAGNTANEPYRYLHQAFVLDRYANDLGISTILRVLDLPFEFLHFDGVFLHASFIEWKGKAVLFTAPKQTGKSTQAALWEKYNQAVIINGDRALLRKEEDKWFAFGSPYCGTSQICQNKELPIAAIIILGQSNENYLSQATTMQALQALLNGCSYDSADKAQVMKVLDLADDLIKNIPFWKLDCLPDESAVRLLEKVL